MNYDRDQTMSALARANEIRYARGEIKHQVRDGELTVVEAMREDCIQTMSVYDLLVCQPRWGHLRAARFCRSVPIPENKPVGGLTDRQKTLVAVLLINATSKRKAA
jgi:hypothetical protein